MPTEGFLICDEDDKEKLEKLRTMVQTQTMRYVWSLNNPTIPFPMIVQSSTGCMYRPFSWTLSNQNKWPCICSKLESKE